jgi:hypothetical protein
MTVHKHPKSYDADLLPLLDTEGMRVGHMGQIAVQSLGEKPQLSLCTHLLTSTDCRPSREK